MHYKKASLVGLLAMLAFIFGSAESCKISVRAPNQDLPTPTTSPTSTTTPPTSTTTPPITADESFSGDSGFSTVFTVIPASDTTPEEGEVRAGIYTTAGALDGQPADSCDYLQTRLVPLSEPVEDETRVVARTDDAPLPAPSEGPPLPPIDADESVTLVAGDSVSADGCQDFVRVVAP